jgi:hypothetical protein
VTPNGTGTILLGDNISSQGGVINLNGPVDLTNDATLNSSTINVNNGINGGTNSLTLSGLSNAANTYTVQGAVAFTNPGDQNLVIAGAGSSNTLQLLTSDSALAWNVQGANSGVITGANFAATFTGVQNLTGGAQANTFTFNNGATLGGIVNGGSGSNNAVNFSAYTTPLTFSLSTLNGGSVTDTGSTVSGFTGITNFVTNMANNNTLQTSGLASSLVLTAPTQENVNGSIFNGFSNFLTSNSSTTLSFATPVTTSVQGSSVDVLAGGYSLLFSGFSFSNGPTPNTPNGPTPAQMATINTATNVNNLYNNYIENQNDTVPSSFSQAGSNLTDWLLAAESGLPPTASSSHLYFAPITDDAVSPETVYDLPASANNTVQSYIVPTDAVGTALFNGSATQSSDYLPNTFNGSQSNYLSNSFNGTNSTYVPNTFNGSQSNSGSNSFDGTNSNYVPDTFTGSQSDYHSSSFDGTSSDYVPDSFSGSVPNQAPLFNGSKATDNSGTSSLFNGARTDNTSLYDNSGSLSFYFEGALASNNLGSLLFEGATSQNTILYDTAVGLKAIFGINTNLRIYSDLFEGAGATQSFSLETLTPTIPTIPSIPKLPTHDQHFIPSSLSTLKMTIVSLND